MILTPKIEKQIVKAIEADPSAAVVLPDHAYGSDGRVIVLIDGLPTTLQRHLHTLLLGPLDSKQRMHDTSGVAGNVNPYLYTVVDGAKSPATHCPNNHPYAGNEMPKNSRGYRCRTCYENSLRRQREKDETTQTPNAEKTHCPQDHPYDKENTIIDSAGRRRCRICKKAQSLKYKRSLRPRKDNS